MKRLLLVLLFVPALAGAQVSYISSDLFSATEKDNFLVDAEYVWTAGERIFGYGYAELGEEVESRWFTNHYIDFKLADWLVVGPEVGLANDDNGMVLAGAGFRFEEVPWLGKHIGRSFVFLKMMGYVGIDGDIGVDQWKLIWQTEPLQLWRLSFWSEGFHRFRSDIPNVGQWQFMLSQERFPRFALGFELESFDGRVESRYGLKWNWSP